MFSFFKKKPDGRSITLQLSGLHCSACSLNIDGELEELPGVMSSSTSYAKQISVVTYDPKLTDPTKFAKIIKKLGYTIINS